MKRFLILTLLISLINATENDDSKSFKDSFTHFIKDLKTKTKNEYALRAYSADLPNDNEIENKLPLFLKCDKNAHHSYWCWSVASYMKKISLIGEDYNCDPAAIKVINEKVKNIDSQLQKPEKTIEEWTEEDIQNEFRVKDHFNQVFSGISHYHWRYEAYSRNKCQNALAGIAFPDAPFDALPYSQYSGKHFSSCPDVLTRITAQIRDIETNKPWVYLTDSKHKRCLENHIVNKLVETRHNIFRIQKEEEIFECSRFKESEKE